MTESGDLKPFLDAVHRFADRMANGHGFLYDHIVNPDAPPSVDVLRARTPVVLPRNVRIVGDRIDTDEVFIPGPLRLPSPPTEEERQAQAAAVERREADRQAEMQAHSDRHAELLGCHAGSPILLALLEEHGPRAARWAGQTVQECHGCPSYWDDDEYGTHSGEVHHEWPCPTWTTIAEQTR